MFLVTVRHTGTTSLKNQYPECEHRHCDETALKRIRAGEPTLTTYRDPAEVADSWKRRGWFEHKKFKDMWWSQWNYYDAITRLENVEVVPVESLDLHLNHIEGADHPGKFLNESILEHAYTCSENAMKYIRADDGHLHITTYMIIRETQRLLSEGDKIGYAKGATVANELFKEIPLNEFNLSLDDFSDKYIAPKVKEIRQSGCMG